MNRSKRKGSAGWALLELLVVLAFAGMLFGTTATLLLTQFRMARTTADAVVQSSYLSQVRAALELELQARWRGWIEAGAVMQVELAAAAQAENWRYLENVTAGEVSVIQRAGGGYQIGERTWSDLEIEGRWRAVTEGTCLQLRMRHGTALAYQTIALPMVDGAVEAD